MSQNSVSADATHENVQLIIEGENLEARITQLPIADDSATDGGASHVDALMPQTHVSDDPPTISDTDADFDPLIGGSGSQPIFPGATCERSAGIAYALFQFEISALKGKFAGSNRALDYSCPRLYAHYQIFLRTIFL